MKILLDARLYGLEHTGVGRYTIKLIDELQKLDAKNDYFILLRKKYHEKLKLNPNFTKILADIPQYTLKEQLALPRLIKKYNPDLVHFLHFNVPIRYKGKFIVTLHDMTMHTAWGAKSTNLRRHTYFLKHFFYKRVFNYAVKKSLKIIVPSQTVKAELINTFKISKQKVEVTYEGI